MTHISNAIFFTIMTALTTTVATANPDYHIGSKISQNIGSLDVDRNTEIDAPTFIGVNFGITYPNGIGIALEYDKSLSADITSSIKSLGNGRELVSNKVGEADFSKLATYLTYTMSPETTSKLYLTSRLGVARIESQTAYQATISQTEPEFGSTLITTVSSSRSNENDTGIVAGIGAGYKLTPQLSLNGRYDYGRFNTTVIGITETKEVTQSLNLLSLGLNYHF